ncbi:glycoside hydrolase family 5 protein, partial [Clostridioides difficile]
MAAVAFTGWSPKAAAADASQVVAEMGAGWNLGNQLEASVNGTPNETAWGNPAVTPELIKKVKAAGFKSIRIPVSYLNNIGSAPNYTINAAWLNRIQQVVDYAYNEGLY